MNAQMPMSVDKNTRMESVTLLAPNVIQYNYTLNNISTLSPENSLATSRWSGR
jgi:hypothetical protein